MDRTIPPNSQPAVPNSFEPTDEELQLHLSFITQLAEMNTSLIVHMNNLTIQSNNSNATPLQGHHNIFLYNP